MDLSQDRLQSDDLPIPKLAIILFVVEMGQVCVKMHRVHVIITGLLMVNEKCRPGLKLDPFPFNSNNLKCLILM
jgi:hypothetical protein